MLKNWDTGLRTGFNLLEGQLIWHRAGVVYLVLEFKKPDSNK